MTDHPREAVPPTAEEARQALDDIEKCNPWRDTSECRKDAATLRAFIEGAERALADAAAFVLPSPPPRDSTVRGIAIGILGEQEEVYLPVWFEGSMIAYGWNCVLAARAQPGQKDTR